jgi:hypothetical protein
MINVKSEIPGKQKERGVTSSKVVQTIADATTYLVVRLELESTRYSDCWKILLYLMAALLSSTNLPGSSSTNVLVPKQQQPLSSLDIPALQVASRVLQDQMMKDTQIIPDLGEMFTYGASQLF